MTASLTACAPGTPDADSWRIDASRATSDTSSAVQAAELALRQGRAGRLFDAYLQTVVVDAEKSAGAAADSIGTVQPPLVERDRQDAVTAQLDAASSLLTTVRIAVVEEQVYRYPALVDRLADAVDSLQSLETDLERSPR